MHSVLLDLSTFVLCFCICNSLFTNWQAQSCAPNVREKEWTLSIILMADLKLELCAGFAGITKSSCITKSSILEIHLLRSILTNIKKYICLEVSIEIQQLGWPNRLYNLFFILQRQAWNPLWVLQRCWFLGWIYEHFWGNCSIGSSFYFIFLKNAGELCIH